MAAARRLPGIRIDLAPPPAALALPRMDVAVLVGFASTGPLHLAVAVESVGQYAAVFGADPLLAWNAERGEREPAYLGAAVRAFFANGGRRCWVIRVARQAAAEALWRGVPAEAAAELPDVARANRYAVPGVLACPAAGAPTAAATATARCEGSWSDDAQLACALVQRSVRVDGLADAGADAGLPALQRLRLRTRTVLNGGDLLLFGDPAATCAYAVVGEVAAASASDGSAPGGSADAALRVVAAFERVVDAAPGNPPAGIDGRLDIAGFAAGVPAAWVAPGVVVARTPLPAALRRGHWACWQGAGGVVWLRIDDVRRQAARAGADDAGLPLAGPAWRELPAALPAALAGVPHARALTLDLRVQRGAGAATLAGVGLAPAHPAAWWLQLPDADFHASGEAATARPAERFALARDDGALPLAWLPLGVEPVFTDATAALPQRHAPLQRDGLSRFDAELFLDPELADASVGTLPGLADTIRLLRDDPRPLFGLHAALAIGEGGLFGEASLIALPDAVHAGWLPRADAGAAAPPATPPLAPAIWRRHRGACADAGVDAGEPAPAGPDFGGFIDCDVRLLQAPLLIGPADPLPPGPYRLDWTDAEPAATYVLSASTRADAADATEVYRGTGTSFAGYAGSAGVRLYQVRAEQAGLSSAGSNVVAVRVVSGDFVERVRAPGVADDDEAQLWLRVHRAALRLAAAGGDLFSVLALPRHFRTPDAVRYAARLRTVRQAGAARPGGAADRDALGFDEARALSYGALYHPWLQTGAPVAAAAPAVRAVPPDGAALGVIAARAARRGAWLAPANEALRDVVGTALPADDADRLALQDAQVNLLRDDPRGLIALSADTLALEDDAELRPVNVRRLLTLLRRLALRRGTTYVFEPLGPVLRRAVQRAFSELMADLFRRGAFAGDTPEAAWRVVADAGVGSADDDEAGRFVVELRVAPSQPMRFIGVRLVQSGERLSVAEEL